MARVKVVLADLLGFGVDSLQPDVELADLGADEEALANVATLLARELGVDRPYEQVDSWETVDDVLTSVRAQAS
ncbi:acyl carrier protein [Streptomyces noursei]|uniref:acyl carrier protein n=1 Tax=Streptomyces noursei TaxID=1971 RepID=UPI0015E0BC5C|nr:acyl carrier protein [Streptomyces noursei]